MKKRRRLSFTAQFVLTVGLILMAANIALGIITVNQSKAAMRMLINKNMLDVTNSAAGLLDGDELAALTADDVGGETYNKIANALTVFLKNVDIRFIYTVRQEGEGRFVFVVDPDPVEPAEFGEEIVVASGLVQAGKGTAAVDDVATADRWGKFYSAYSPVFDSAGNVAAIVGIDFDADWYEAQVRKHTLTVGIVSLLSILLGGVVIFLITHRVRAKFSQLSAGLTQLAGNVDQLMDEVESISGYRPKGRKEAGEEPECADEFEALSLKLQGMQDDMGLCLEHMRRQAYIDALTGVGSATAYHEAADALEAQIARDTADFQVAVFDVNSLKEINDNEGHQCGDFIIRSAAEAISGVFGAERTYRIGGDEFAVLAEKTADEEMERCLADVRAAVDSINARSGRPFDVDLSLSAGCARFEAGSDNSFKTVFARADGRMYQAKKAYYQQNNRRDARKEHNPG